jgi:hypothetical protein
MAGLLRTVSPVCIRAASDRVPDPRRSKWNIRFARSKGEIETIWRPIRSSAAANGPIWFHNVGPNFPADWADQACKLNTTKVKITREKAGDGAIADYLGGNK